MIKNVKINGVEYDVQDGIVYRETATEELDSGVIQIFNVSKLDLEPMQSVEIEFVNGEKKYLIVNTWVEENATFDISLKNYIISLISETKKLERCIMPNTAITQPLDIENKRKYTRYLFRTKDLYIRPIYDNVEISSELADYLSNQDAIEEQFTTPNVKEYLNSILSKTNAIVTMQNNLISYYDLNVKGNAINEDKLFFKNSEQKIDEYYSNIYTDVQNAQSEVVLYETISPRAINSPVLTTDNLVIELSHNINTIVEVYVWSPNGFENSYGEKVPYGFYIYSDKEQWVNGTAETRIFKRVLEKSQYDCLKVQDFSISVSSKDYKLGNLYFTRNTNVIAGLNYKESNWFTDMFWPSTAIEKIFENISVELHPNGIYPVFKGDIRDLIFGVKYTTLDDVSVDTSKQQNIKSYIRDNQTDSIVDLDKFAKVEQEKIDRIGNEAITIAGRYDTIEDVPKLLDYIDDYVLAEREMVYYTDYIDFKGVLYKNFVKKNVFYGVNSKIRSTQLLPVNEAIVKKELTKIKYKFGFEDTTNDKKFTSYLLSGIANLSSANREEEYSTYLHLLISKFTAQYEDGTTSEFRLEPSKYYANNSILLNYKFNDNINVGAKVGLQQVGGYEQKYIPYTDNNGEFEKLTLTLYNGLASGYNVTDENWVKDFPNVSENYIDENKAMISEVISRYKDNREILNETIQIEFNTDKDIFVNSDLMKVIPLIGVPTSKKDLYVYVSTEQKYYKNMSKDDFNYYFTLQDRDTDPRIIDIDSSVFKNYALENVYFNKIILYNNSDVNINEIVSWALADMYGNVVFAVNKPENMDVIPTTIYLNKEE